MGSGSVLRYANQIFGDRPLLEWLKLLLRSQTASKLATAVHHDQGAVHDVVQLAGITNELVCHQPHIGYAAREKKVLRGKFSLVKFSSLATKGKKKENFYPAKISRYTVY